LFEGGSEEHAVTDDSSDYDTDDSGQMTDGHRLLGRVAQVRTAVANRCFNTQQCFRRASFFHLGQTAAANHWPQNHTDTIQHCSQRSENTSGGGAAPRQANRGVYPYLPMATNAPWSFFWGGGNEQKV